MKTKLSILILLLVMMGCVPVPAQISDTLYNRGATGHVNYITSFYPLYDGNHPDNNIRIEYGVHKCCNIDSGKLIIPKDTVRAIRIILKQFLKTRKEEDSIEGLLFKTRIALMKSYQSTLNEHEDLKKLFSTLKPKKQTHEETYHHGDSIKPLPY